MYCIRCGNQIKDSAKYCVFCGAPTANALNEASQPADEEKNIAIPGDAFSARTSNDNDHFDIHIPGDFIPSESALPENADGELDFARMLERDDIQEEPQEIEDLAFTRMVSVEAIKDCVKDRMTEPEQEEQPQAIPDEIENEEFTGVISVEEIHSAQKEALAAEQKTMEDIPNIPIPVDFIAAAQEEEDIPMPETEEAPTEAAVDHPEETEKKELTKQDVLDALDSVEKELKTQEAAKTLDDDNASDAPVWNEEQQENQQEISDIPLPKDFISSEQQTEFEEDEPEEYEPIMTRRGIISVVIVVILLFAIAVGAFASMLSGNFEVSDSGSGVTEFQSPKVD